ncbi:MAG TPA: hypothetical protein VNU21_20990 [Usitatibacter sp.]|jgi:hypothetical protein|nr:hypothetical protein [Usitatibacter sp.]
MLAWIRDLETAKDASDVVFFARAYLAALAPAAASLLPPACRARPIESSADVRFWSQCLSEEYWRRRAAGLVPEAMQEAWSFFLRANVQVSRLASRGELAEY